MNKFKVKKKHLVGNIKDFPVHIVQAMVDEHARQGCEANLSELAANPWFGFGWKNTEQGHDFWYRVIIEREFDLIPKPVKPKGNIHAKRMMQYAKDAATSETPWERWECRHQAAHIWSPMLTHPIWDTRVEYRRKQKTKVETKPKPTPHEITKPKPTPHEIIQAMLANGMTVWACVSDSSYDNARERIGNRIHRIVKFQEDSQYPVKTSVSWRCAVPVDITTMTEITELP